MSIDNAHDDGRIDGDSIDDDGDDYDDDDKGGQIKQKLNKLSLGGRFGTKVGCEKLTRTPLVGLWLEMNNMNPFLFQDIVNCDPCS